MTRWVRGELTFRSWTADARPIHYPASRPYRLTEMTASQQKELVQTLRARFEKNRGRHADIEWAAVEKRLDGNAKAMKSLQAMEDSGGEPDVIGTDPATRKIMFCDCSAQSPAGRRSICYDRKALDARKKNKPANSAMDMASAMGIEMLTEAQYRALQQLGEFDTKTSSWVKTPADVRSLGGALFCDRRYDKVFVYHNGADSYYAARGFRGMLLV